MYYDLALCSTEYNSLKYSGFFSEFPTLFIVELPMKFMNRLKADEIINSAWDELEVSNEHLLLDIRWRFSLESGRMLSLSLWLVPESVPILTV